MDPFDGKDLLDHQKPETKIDPHPMSTENSGPLSLPNWDASLENLKPDKKSLAANAVPDHPSGLPAR